MRNEKKKKKGRMRNIIMRKRMYKNEDNEEYEENEER